MNASIDNFSDLDDFDNAPAAKPRAQISVKCPACSGSGTKVIGYRYPKSVKCFECNGTGQVHPDHDKRKAAHRKGEVTKAQNLSRKVAEWKAAYPGEAGWLLANAGKSDFAHSLNEGLHTYGHLTPGQLAAAQRSIAREAEQKEQKKTQQAASGISVGTGANAVLVALTHAYKGGIAPKLRTASVVFTFAKPGSRNPGCAYVTEQETDLYLGKITPDGVFQPSRGCTSEQKSIVTDTCHDPLAAAIIYGRVTGECSCCGRRLTDPVSIANGIGPICQQGFGW